jgi:hypothetical protein
MASGKGVAALWFAELDFDFGVSDSAVVAAGIEGVLSRSPRAAPVRRLASLPVCSSHADQLKRSRTTVCLQSSYSRTTFSAIRCASFRLR